ncbi:hypothetical protein BpHYR1_039131 [Brachionus plicatilis]|uniref:Uncharacterized protein n=1 Tax=Brachionus plicatilis TaxID=10195 RepID=A0A3M7P386_BRAPC|nr:hypothetical protein BpHYR1_039131 [Brachionus plicatilis]
MKTENNEKLNYNQAPLNSWFRQQGGKTSSDLTGPPIKYSHDLILPSIKTCINQGKEIDFSIQNKRVVFSSSEYSIKVPKLERECKTPQQSNYYQKCIDDVYNCNKPDKMNLKIPRELTYVRSIPNIKYITVCSGKTFKNVWQLIRLKPENASNNQMSFKSIIFMHLRSLKQKHFLSQTTKLIKI